MEVTNTLGRRKTAVASLYMKPGTGEIKVNQRDYKEYLCVPTLQYKVEQPLRVAEVLGQYDIKANLDGGGMTGQAEALRMAIAKALVEINPELRSAMKAQGFLRRDPRMVERKKPGQPKARKRFQFSTR